MNAKSYKTAEFWLTSVCVVLTMLAASGAFGEQDNVYKVIEMGIGALAAVGYQFSRASVKKESLLEANTTDDSEGPRPDWVNGDGE